MKLTMKCVYALLSINYLNNVNGRKIGSKEIADKFKISKGFLNLICLELKKHGILNAIKGPNGGYSLAREFNSITVLEVYNITKEHSLKDTLNESKELTKLMKIMDKKFDQNITFKISELF